MDEICNDRYGRLLNNTKRVCFPWEVYNLCLLPIFYSINKIDEKLIKLFTKCYFRNFGLRKKIFKQSIFNKFIDVTNNVLNDSTYDYYSNILNYLHNNEDLIIKDDVYIDEIKKKNFENTDVKYLLYFLETAITTDEKIVCLTSSLEHIYCKKNKADLNKSTLIDNIGNLTILEQQNTDESGHKGNSSLGSKSYDKKIKSYQGSSCFLTQQIGFNYIEFNEQTIIERSIEITNLLNEKTNF